MYHNTKQRRNNKEIKKENVKKNNKKAPKGLIYILLI